MKMLTSPPGLGVYFAVRELLRTEAKTKYFGLKNIRMEDQRVIVQGFGNGMCVHMCTHSCMHLAHTD